MRTVTRIEVHAARAGAAPRVTLRQGPLQARRLRDRGATVRLALVAGQALLLAEDRVRLEVSVVGPVQVEITETGGTVAYDMRGGSATWDVDIDLRGAAELTWESRPFVLAAGADVVRRTDVLVEEGCAASLRETIVFGRAGEVGGSLEAWTRMEHAAVPVLVEHLDLAAEARAGWAILRGHRCLDSLMTVGRRLPDGPDVLQLDGPGSVRRWIGDELHRSSLV